MIHVRCWHILKGNPALARILVIAVTSCALSGEETKAIEAGAKSDETTRNY